MTSTYVVAAHVLLAVGLFLIINWIGSHSLALGYLQLSLFPRADEAPAFNLVFRVLTPVVYIVIVSAGLYLVGLDAFTKNVFLVVLYYFIIRLAFNVLVGRSRLLNWPLQFVYLILSTTLAYLAYKYLITQRTHLLPDFASMANELWVVIFAFVYLLFNRVRLPTTATERRKQTYLHHRYALYRSRYGELIASKTQDAKTEALIYAVMIYEAFNRPKLYRGIEHLLFRFGRATTLGVMQVRTTAAISDWESVGLGADIIVREYRNAMADEGLRRDIEKVSDSESRRAYQERRVIRAVLLKYNPSQLYASEVERLYGMVRKAFYPGI